MLILALLATAAIPWTILLHFRGYDPGNATRSTDHYAGRYSEGLVRLGRVDADAVAVLAGLADDTAVSIQAAG